MATRMCDVLRFIQSCDKADLETIKADVDLHLTQAQEMEEKRRRNVWLNATLDDNDDNQ